MSAPIQEDESRVLITAVLHSAIKEYVYPTTIHIFQDRKRRQYIAGAFLFDDDYLLDWGDNPISPRDLLLSIDLDIDWIRDKVIKKQQELGDNPRYSKGTSLL